jgi:hypothetical protein
MPRKILTAETLHDTFFFFVDSHENKSRLDGIVVLSEIFHAYRLMTADGRQKQPIIEPLLANDA